MNHSKPTRDPSRESPEGVLFRSVFGEPQHAVGLLRSYLPPEVVASIDWTSLRRVDQTLVDDTLTDLQADVLFLARIGDRPGFLYLLLERASDGRPVEFHVARNIASLLEQWALEHPEATDLPPVVPYVLRLGQQP